ncbi:DUF4905 domain-containing protein [Dawidia soli]|uniref:DUF4905 domain-containing protein n=1 Tax=Dawidia soli TaxID=2782352 RepID=A0AAP2DD82_9BACT|nr:DUF4905 domain-containing protein [Dawidia soli]MBT1690001.1 DUF4905 domain-containing protein [Dawidia soli]
MLQRKFSHVLDGVLWNTVVLPDENVLLLEVRDHARKQVTFSALHYGEDRFLWHHKSLEEPWWVALADAAGGIVLFTLYIDTNNPDRKGMLAYALADLQLLWWHNDFTLAKRQGDCLYGFSSGVGSKPLVLALHSGKEIPPPHEAAPLPDVVLRPQQYGDGTEYFRTVAKFLRETLNLSVVLSLEYVEYNGKIFIAYYTQEQSLVSHLAVWTDAGELLLQEKTGEHLKGIGQDTFFILSGCLFFVKNKHELLSYFL